MPDRRRLVGAGCLVASLFALLPADGLAEPSAKDRSRAKRLDRVGKDAYREGKFTDAAIAFDEAYQADPKPKYLYNLAKSREKADQLAAAVESYELYLEVAPEAEDADRVRGVMEFLDAKVRRSFGKIEVTSKPDRSAVAISGAGVERASTTPLSAWLAPGPYEAVVTRPGYETVRTTVEVKVGESTPLEVVLAEVGAAHKQEPETPPAEKAESAAVPEEPPAEKPMAKAPATAEKAPKAAKAPKTAPPPAEPGGSSMATIAAFGVAGVALVAGLALGGLAFSKNAEYEEAVGDRRSAGSTRAASDDLAETRDTYAIAASAALVLAAAAGATGGILMLTSSGDGAQAAVRWSW